jgi:hypothetical protein
MNDRIRNARGTEIKELLELGDREIAAGNGFDLDEVIAEADRILTRSEQTSNAMTDARSARCCDACDENSKFRIQNS